MPLALAIGLIIAVAFILAIAYAADWPSHDG